MVDNEWPEGSWMQKSYEAGSPARASQFIYNEFQKQFRQDLRVALEQLKNRRIDQVTLASAASITQNVLRAYWHHFGDVTFSRVDEEVWRVHFPQAIDWGGTRTNSLDVTSKVEGSCVTMSFLVPRPQCISIGITVNEENPCPAPTD